MLKSTVTYSSLKCDQHLIINKYWNEALVTLRNKIRQEPIGFELLPNKFTLTQLQNIYEVILGTTLDKRNFRKKIAKMKYLIPLDEKQKGVAHKPARLYVFNREIYEKTKKNLFAFTIWPSLMTTSDKINIKEKIGYALGDGVANIAWRGVATFLFIFYTDVFGIDPVAVGLLMLIARSSDGISDVVMGIIGDRTNSMPGKFRPWILWKAIPLGIILSLLFTSPNLGPTGKIIYTYSTYILFTLIYTANNIPYGALMGVMTGDDKERTSIGSYRMVGAFAGGMLVQGALLYLVAAFGDVNPQITLHHIQADRYHVTVSSPEKVPNANIKTNNGIALFQVVGSTP
jgi:hypothetical protein